MNPLNYKKHIFSKLIILLATFLQITFISAQNKDLEKLSYIQLENRIDSLNSVRIDVMPIINFYISKSKKEKNIEALIYAYRYSAMSSDFPEDIKYSDSILNLAKKNNDKKLITEAYLNKNNISIKNNQFKEALTYTIIANKYAKQLNDDYIINKTKYFIAQNKIYLGLFNEANYELYDCIKYFKGNVNSHVLGKDYELYYLYSLMSIIDSNSKLLKHKENAILLKEANKYIESNNLKNYKPYFISCEGSEAYYQGNYNLAIIKLKKAISLYHDRWPHFTEIYYLGLSYWKLNNKSEAIKYFEKLDKEYYKEKNQDPKFRPAYELLIDYYKSKNNTEKQLEYINKLMILDKSYEKNYKYLFAKISKDYDTKKLIEEKNNIETKLEFHRSISFAILFLSIIILVFISYKYYSVQKNYKEKFQEILTKNVSIKDNNTLVLKNSELSSKLENYSKIPGLNEVTTENILKQLENFEKENAFLYANITQKILSEKLGTNINYLSKIINIYKEKNFNNYINDLRLEYILDKLKTDSSYLNKDVKELANISGFNNAEGFSDNFKRKFDMKPSVFVKMMRENIKNSSQSHNQASNSENV